ncbi:MAG: rpsB, partial [Alphaproteobacteria bacterium]|nr:rpsB [Alphaproteobacteria bacterium]
PMLYTAMSALQQIVSKGGRVLFVGTKRQAADQIKEAAERCGQFYVNHRWLGGMLTNWKTITASINRLKQLDTALVAEGTGYTKRELLEMEREREKLMKALGGIKDMGGVPDAIFVIDTIKEELAIKEAQKLGIPVIAIIDTNSEPEGITYPIPGNDDALRAIETYCELISGAILDGLQAEANAKGVDVGASSNPEEAMMKGDRRSNNNNNRRPQGSQGAGKKSADVVKLDTAKNDDTATEEAPKAAQGGL